jgi:hypothetical protein
VSRRHAHEAKASEVACLALGPLILLGAGGVVAGEVEVTEGCTRSGHHLLELLLLVPEVVLLLQSWRSHHWRSRGYCGLHTLGTSSSETSSSSSCP